MAFSLRYLASEYDSSTFEFVDLIISSIAKSDFAISISVGMSISSEFHHQFTRNLLPTHLQYSAPGH
jgi:hypothetical protein